MNASASRKHVFYSGRVQGVGFRYTVNTIARNYQVTGWVRNLHDGRVELLAEGASQELQAMLADIAAAMGGNIKGADIRDGEATGEFDRFRVTDTF
jgi:acylphosphatase